MVRIFSKSVLCYFKTETKATCMLFCDIDLAFVNIDQYEVCKHTLLSLLAPVVQRLDYAIKLRWSKKKSIWITLSTG